MIERASFMISFKNILAFGNQNTRGHFMHEFSHKVRVGSQSCLNCNLKQMTFTANHSDSELNKSQNGAQALLSFFMCHWTYICVQQKEWGERERERVCFCVYKDDFPSCCWTMLTVLSLNLNTECVYFAINFDTSFSRVS